MSHGFRIDQCPVDHELLMQKGRDDDRHGLSVFSTFEDSVSPYLAGTANSSARRWNSVQWALLANK